MTATQEQAVISTAPESNDEGFTSAVMQLLRVATTEAKWRCAYDKHSDSLTLYKSEPVPSVSYFMPEEPRLLFRLDETTAELVGMDLTDFRRYFAKRYARLKNVLPPPAWLRYLGFDRQRYRLNPRDILSLIFEIKDRNNNDLSRD